MPLWVDVLIFSIFVLLLTLLIFKAIQSILQQVASGGQASSRGQLITTAKTLLSFLQLLSLVVDFNLQWPSGLASFLGASSGAGGANLNFTFLSCLLGWNEQQRHMTFSVLPVLCLLIPALALCLITLLAKKQRSTSGSGRASMLLEVSSPYQVYSTIVLFLLFLVYPTVSRQALRAISCLDVDGSLFLSFDLGVRCDDGHTMYQVLAWLQVVFISFGVPLGLFILLYRKRNELQREEVRRVYHFLYSGYTPRAYWFESARMLLKWALVASSTLLVNDPYGVRVFFGLFVLLVGLAVQLSVQPYANPLQSKLELASFLICVFFLLSGLFFASDTGNKTGETILLLLGITGTCIYIIICLYTIAYDVWQSGKAKKMAKAISQAKRKGSLAMSGAISAAMQEDTRWGRLMESIASQLRSLDDKLNRGELCKCTFCGGSRARTGVTTWEEYTADDGDQYYFNRETEETTWEKPDEVSALEAFGESVAHAWIMQASKASGLRTYFNTITQFRTDKRPVLMPLARAECWEIKMDPQLHIPYYHNTLTHENEFLKPAEFVPTEAQMDEWGWFMKGQDGAMATTGNRRASNSNIQMSNPIRKDAEEDNYDNQGSPSSIASTKSIKNDAWSRHTDDNGDVFWSNKLTGESMWDDEYEALMKA